ncbi:hypothetical protein AB0L33_30265 [Streptomyces sp. NPDC052299]|uniref:hypothetical protein n=1 Tax=Streptomyces sp. NPDC052299 TaxID=3155054 RepID=UPI00342EB472
MTTALTPAPRAGGIDDIRREDDARGYERDETDQFHRLVDRLVFDGDSRAEAAGRRARRTLAEMAPGYQRQPFLRLVRPLTFQRADDACVLCGFWKCRCGGAAPAPAPAAHSTAGVAR